MTNADWPFEQPRDSAVFALRSIVFGDEPILYVRHDGDDDGWQFLDGKPIDMTNAALVALGDIVTRDSSVLELADMPPGWAATRVSASSPWQRSSEDGV